MDYVKDNLTLVVLPEKICKIADQDLGAYDVELDEGLQSAGLTSRCSFFGRGERGAEAVFFGSRSWKRQTLTSENSQSLVMFRQIYPLVMTNIAMERSTMFKR